MTHPTDAGFRGTEVLRALPAQLIEIPDGVVLKRGASEIRIAGEGARETVRILYGLTAEGATRDEVREAFAVPAWPGVAELIEQLSSRRFLVAGNGSSQPQPTVEDNADVFYWQFGTTAVDVADRLTALSIAVLGVNFISRRLASALADAGAGNVEVVNYPLLCNLRFLNEDGSLSPDQWPRDVALPVDYAQWTADADRLAADILIATSDFGGRDLMRQWNRFAVERGIHFLPVVLENLIGHVGPLVIPGEVPCYECLRARENSHMTDPELTRVSESRAVEGQRIAAFHPSMASILGDIAAVEMARVYGQWSPSGVAGRLLEVNLLTGSMTPRRLLKLPRCAVCGTDDRRASAATTKVAFREGLTLYEGHHRGD